MEITIWKFNLLGVLCDWYVHGDRAGGKEARKAGV